MAEVEWLDDDEQRMWRGLLHAFALLNLRLERELRRHGLSLADYEILAQLSELPGRVRMTQLAEQLVFTKSRLSHQVRRLEDAGLLRRERCEEDRRGWYLSLTSGGRRRLAAAAKTHVAGVRRHLFDHTDADDVRAMADVFEAVVDALRDLDRPDRGSDALTTA